MSQEKKENLFKLLNQSRTKPLKINKKFQKKLEQCVGDEFESDNGSKVKKIKRRL